MLLIDFLSAALFGLGAFLSAFAALALISGRTKKAKRLNDVSSDLAGSTLVFLIRDGQIVDSNFSGQRYLDALPDAPNDLERLRTALKSRVDDADLLLSVDTTAGDFSSGAVDGTFQVLRETTGNSVRLKVMPQVGEQAGVEDIHRLDALERELATLRANTDAAPFLVWRQNAAGDVTWVNRAYLEQVENRFGTNRRMTWPLPQLFGDSTPSSKSSRWPRRVSHSSDDGQSVSWFDCNATPVGTDTLFTAVNADEAVRAEKQLRDFTQTLTKTFADLTVGLAIFDRSRHLALFNPSLTELSHLPIDFLTARPSLVGFLDELREYRMMPEPKDYRSWRKSIEDLETAAADGHYCETWTLPDNQTYRVTGRPHPDGAIAFLFEDISDEMSLTRRFRAELELGQAVIDNLDEAVAVFSASGALTMANSAYRRLWNAEQEESMSIVTAIDASRIWHEMTVPNPIWGDFRDFTQSTTDRSEWTATAKMRDGRPLQCRFAPVAGGATLAVFRLLSQSTEHIIGLREAV